MDFSKLDATDAANEGVTIHLKHPSTLMPLYHEDDPNKPVTITVMGEASDRYKELTDQINKRAGVRYVAAKGNEEKVVDPELTSRENILRLARTCTAWTFIGNADGELEFNERNAVEFLTKFDWAREQVIAGQTDISNFLPASEKASGATPKDSSNSTPSTKAVSPKKTT
jgi:hypothetical protein